MKENEQRKLLMPNPSLSVIITTYNARATVVRCLDSLQRQTLPDPFEIILVDSSTDGTAAMVAERYPEVTLLRFAERKYCGDARNIGIAHARGEIIAFLDADCVAAPTWAAAIVAAHREHGTPLIGGTVDNGNPEAYSGWAYYFSEFSTWMPGSPQALIEEIPGCVLTLKRWAFARYGPFIEGTYCSDSAFHWQLAKDGYRPLLMPTICIAHMNPTGVRGLLRHARKHGQNFGTVRSSEQGFSVTKRRLYALLAPLLPLVLFVRTLRNVFRKRAYRRQFVMAAPLVLLTQIAWAYGEWQGYRGGIQPRVGRAMPQSVNC